MANRLRVDKQVQAAAGLAYLFKSDATGEYQNFAPGTQGQVAKVTAGGDLVYSSPLTIAAGSTNYLTFNATTGELSIEALGITGVTTDAVSADLSTFVAASYTVGTEFQEGDVVILTTPGEVYINNGGVANDATDFTQIETPGLTNAAIRALFSSANTGIDYNATTGVFTFQVSSTANNDLALDGNGLFLDVSESSATDTNSFAGGGSQTIQTILDAITAKKFLPDTAATGDVVYFDGTNWVKATKVLQSFTPAAAATTATLSGTPIGAMDVIGWSNGIYEGDVSGSVAGTTWTLPFTANGTDIFQAEFYTA